MQSPCGNSHYGKSVVARGCYSNVHRFVDGLPRFPSCLAGILRRPSKRMACDLKIRRSGGLEEHRCTVNAIQYPCAAATTPEGQRRAGCDVCRATRKARRCQGCCNCSSRGHSSACCTNAKVGDGRKQGPAMPRSKGKTVAKHGNRTWTISWRCAVKTLSLVPSTVFQTGLRNTVPFWLLYSKEWTARFCGSSTVTPQITSVMTGRRSTRSSHVHRSPATELPVMKFVRRGYSCNAITRFQEARVTGCHLSAISSSQSAVE
jgi:hypothetical protein